MLKHESANKQTYWTRVRVNKSQTIPTTSRQYLAMPSVNPDAKTDTEQGLCLRGRVLAVARQRADAVGRSAIKQLR